MVITSLTMTFDFVCAVLVNVIVFITPVYSAERGSRCATPNNENAFCIAVKSCKVITNAVITRNPDAISFAKQSQCGYDTDPLVCCGSTGYPASFTIYKHPLLPDKSSCGLERNTDRVYGGEITDIDEFPWVVLLRYKDGFGDDVGFKCGGTLINNRYVLTAAHCVLFSGNYGFVLDSVRLGEWKMSTTRDCLGQKHLEECADAVVDIGVQKTVPHSQYSRKTRDNDIALVRLKSNVRYTDFIRPICIPAPETPSAKPGTKLLVAGWGATENSSNSDIKLKVQVPVVSLNDCKVKIGQRGYISENQVCAGGIRGKDSCQGDSGGPLMKILEDSSFSQYQWIQEGVISWGIGCGIPGFPGVYTRVARYSKWVVEQMENF